MLVRAPVPMTRTESGRIRVLILHWFANALSPTKVTVFGMLTDVSKVAGEPLAPLTIERAYFPICVTV